MSVDPNLEELIQGVEVDAASDQPLVRLGVAVRRRGELDEVAEALLDHFVAEARSAGCSWSQIGDELGITKQAAQQRHNHERSTTRRLLARVLPDTRSRFGLPGGEFSADARQAIVAAQIQAEELGHGYVGTEHLLLGVSLAEDSIAGQLLASFGVDYPTTRAQVVAVFGRGDHPPTARLAITPGLKKVLERAPRHTSGSGSGADASLGHLLAALLAARDSGAVGVLQSHGVDVQALRNSVESHIDGSLGT